ncbi:unnamed protein product [Cunninghamella blakesleeana]
MIVAGSYIYKKIKDKKKDKESSQELDDYQRKQLKHNAIASYIIDQYKLKPHPEGGYYAETYRSPLSSLSASPFSADQEMEEVPFTNTIYYLLYQENNHSCFHKNQNIETWHYYDGNTSMVIYEITSQFKIKIHRLGRNLAEGEHFTIMVEKDSWVAAELCHGSALEEKKVFALVGRSSIPATTSNDHDDHLATFDEMIRIFPQNVDLINRLIKK